MIFGRLEHKNHKNIFLSFLNLHLPATKKAKVTHNITSSQSKMRFDLDEKLF